MTMYIVVCKEAGKKEYMGYRPSIEEATTLAKLAFKIHRMSKWVKIIDCYYNFTTIAKYTNESALDFEIPTKKSA